jgi:hypothetical protein
MITRPRQISLRQMTLHFSCTATAPHTGQMTESLSESADLRGFSSSEISTSFIGAVTKINYTRFRSHVRFENRDMKFSEKIKQQGAAGWILLWLIGIPVPILLVLFLLRGCT